MPEIPACRRVDFHFMGQVAFVFNCFITLEAVVRNTKLGYLSMFSFLNINGVEKRKRFLIGNLSQKSDEERQLYQLSFQSLHKVRIGGRSARQENDKQVWHEVSGLFSDAAEGNTDQHQTYVQWRAATDMDLLGRLTSFKRNSIYIQPIGYIPQNVLKFSLELNSVPVPLLGILKLFTEIYFLGKSVNVLPCVFIDEQGWRVTERVSKLTGEPQLNVREFFPYLKKLLPANGICIMGLSWLDLYPSENLNFVLGESATAHKSGVFCFGHFGRTSDPSNPVELMTVDGSVLWQLFKTLSHEVCHLFRLEHCPFFHCAMNESHTVSEAMDQPIFLCPVCLRKLQKACGFSLIERYSKMLAFLTAVSHQCPHERFSQSINWLKRCLAFLKTE